MPRSNVCILTYKLVINQLMQDSLPTILDKFSLWVFPFGIPLTALKLVCQGKVFSFVLLSHQCGTSQSTPFGAQCPRWHSSFGAQCPRWHSSLSLIDVGPLPNPPRLEPVSLLAHHLVSTLFGEQPPRWHIVQRRALMPFVTIQAHHYKLSWLCFEKKPKRESQKRTISGTCGSGPLHKQLPFRLN